MSTQLTEASQRYLKETDLAHRKSLGQYFTPKDVRSHLLAQLPRQRGATVLDPACGSGEFLGSAQDYFTGCRLVGWEIDSTLVKLSRAAVSDAEIVLTDSLKTDCGRTFDFVIGNPPYFEFKPDEQTKQKYREVISGRANIFSIFVKLGLDVLKPGGYLAYVIPPSLNNGAYFTGLRRYIVDNANIEYLSILNSPALFHRAQQAVMIMVLKKGPNRGDYIFAQNGLRIFSVDRRKLRTAFRGKTTLKELGFSVLTGKVVWNQNKDRLTRRARNSIPLIWSHNITSDGLALGNRPDKPQYIRSDRYDTGPAIVVNRVTGAATKSQLKAVVIRPGFRFLAENHVNVIYPPVGDDQQERLRLAECICAQISSPRTAEVMRLITGNTQISRTELERLLPIRPPADT